MTIEHEYRIKEIVGKQQFIIQKSFLVRKKIDESKFINRLYIYFFIIENENQYDWRNFTKNGDFNNCYYTEYFKSFEDAMNIVKELKTKGEIKYHII